MNGQINQCKCGNCAPTNNPAVSEAQRRYLNATKGHEWVKDHGFDNEGDLHEKKEDEEEETKKRAVANRLGILTEYELHVTKTSIKPIGNRVSPTKNQEISAVAASSTDQRTAQVKVSLLRRLGKLLGLTGNAFPGGAPPKPSPPPAPAPPPTPADTAAERGESEEELKTDTRTAPTTAPAPSAAQGAAPPGPPPPAAPPPGPPALPKPHGPPPRTSTGGTGKVMGGSPKVTGGTVQMPAQHAPSIENRATCPECGGRMKDGECEDCGWEDPTENAIDFTAQPRHGDTGQYQPHGSGWGKGEAHKAAQDGHRKAFFPNRVSDDGRDVTRLKPVDSDEMVETDEPDDHTAAAVEEGADDTEEDGAGGKKVNKGVENGAASVQTSFAKVKKGTGHSVESVFDKVTNGDEEEDKQIQINSEGELVVVTNAFPPNQENPMDSHQATKDAAAASLHTEHPKAFGHAQAAMQCSSDDDCDGAVSSHAKAANAHEQAAKKVYGSDAPDEKEAEDHLQAAAMHRKAAALHGAKPPIPATNRSTNQSQLMPSIRESSMKLAELKTLAANCSCEATKAALNRSIAELETNAMPAFLKKKLRTNAEDDDDEDEDEDFEENDGPDLHSFDGGGKGTSIQAGGKGTKDEYTGNSNQAIEKWLKTAPKGVREPLNRLIANDRRAKIDEIQKLVRPIGNDQARNLIGNKLLHDRPLTVGEAALLARSQQQAMPTHNVFDSQHEPNYLGAGGGGIDSILSTNAEGDDGDVLTIPTINWREESQQYGASEVFANRKAN